MFRCLILGIKDRTCWRGSNVASKEQRRVWDTFIKNLPKENFVSNVAICFLDPEEIWVLVVFTEEGLIG